MKILLLFDTYTSESIENFNRLVNQSQSVKDFFDKNDTSVYYIFGYSYIDTSNLKFILEDKSIRSSLINNLEKVDAAFIFGLKSFSVVQMSFNIGNQLLFSSLVNNNKNNVFESSNIKFCVFNSPNLFTRMRKNNVDKSEILKSENKFIQSLEKTKTYLELFI